MKAPPLSNSTTASDHWIDYFHRNALEPDLPWNDGTSLSGAERWAVVRSLQQFQLGEGASGARLLRFAYRFCERTGNAGFYCFSRWTRSFSFSSQTYSRMSLSGTRTSVTLTVNGLVYIFGSSIVRLRSICPKSRR
jgi:hypothetical protein